MTPSLPSLAAARDFLQFVNISPSPFHAVAWAKQQLVDAGFGEIKERDAWSSTVHRGGRFFLTRNGSSIVAFAVGSRWKAGNPIAMIGAHTDSPCLRVKPVSKSQTDGFLQVAVETYGGGLWHTWFDRDLSIAGRAMVRAKDGSVLPKLVKVDRPILRIPTLAIHLDGQETFTFNKESQLFPIAGMVAAELGRTGPSKPSAKSDGPQATPYPSSDDALKTMSDRHHPVIVDIVARELGVDPSDILDFEMLLYDTQASCIGGVNDELIFSPRLDNLMMSFCGTIGLIDSLSSASALDDESSVRLLSLFDHEEIGSQTAQGAHSNLLPAVIRRLSLLSFEPKPTGTSSRGEADAADAYERTLASSFLISADMAHSVHPNYPAKYESDHRPQLNQGVVIKINANARYATNSPGIVLLRNIARRAVRGADTDEPSSTGGVPLQLFVVRNDSRCGSTIGPMLSAALGVRTLDLGNPQLSMHSIRETAGVDDVEHAIRLFRTFYQHFPGEQAKIVVD